LKIADEASINAANAHDIAISLSHAKE